MHRVLACDDDPDILDVINITFSSEGLEILTAKDGLEAWEVLQNEPVDVIILDNVMPKMSGLELCRKIKQDPRLCQLPVLLVTGKGEQEDKLMGLESGADDYIVKPFDPKELLIKVKNLLKRTTLILDTNPLTHLPGNNTISEQIAKRIRSKELFAIAYVDLNNFKSYNDKYGFFAGDDLIKTTAEILKENSTSIDPQAFVGHIGGDDFVFMTTPEKVEIIAQKIIEEFDKKIPEFYDPEAREQGFIETLNREHKPEKFPFVSISISIVTNENKSIDHPAQVAQIAAELKRKVKESGKSAYLKDRRSR